MYKNHFYFGVKIAGVLGAGVALLACSGLPRSSAPPLKAATGATLSSCVALVSQMQWPHTRLESATPVAAGALNLGDRPVPAHCLVKGKMHERVILAATGSNDGSEVEILVVFMTDCEDTLELAPGPGESGPFSRFRLILVVG